MTASADDVAPNEQRFRTSPTVSISVVGASASSFKQRQVQTQMLNPNYQLIKLVSSLAQRT